MSRFDLHPRLQADTLLIGDLKLSRLLLMNDRRFPAYQDRGIGTRIWQFAEASYPRAKSWQLGTPIWATKNHHFYENKCGFARLEVKEDEIVYRKEIPSTA